MAFTNTSNKVVYVCDGVSTQFPFSFYFLDGEHIKVYKYHVASGTLTELVRGSDYDITYTNGTPPTEGGRIDTIGDPIPSGYKLIIMREVPLTQEVDYRPNDPFPAETHEQALDKAMMAIQQVQEQVSRAVVQDPTQSEQITMPTPVGGKFLYSPADGQISWSAITATNYPGAIARGNDADKSSNPSAGDVYYATDTGIMYVCFSNGVWTPYYADTVRLTTDQTIEGIKTFKSQQTRFGDSSISGDINIDLINSAGQGQIRFSQDGWIGIRNGASGGHQIQIKSDGTIALPYQTPSASEDVVTKGYVDGLPILKAWVCYDGASQSVLSSYGVASVSKTSTGVYVVNFPNAMPDTNYAVIATQQGATVNNQNINTAYSNKTTTSVTIRVYQDTNYVDAEVSVMIIR